MPAVEIKLRSGALTVAARVMQRTEELAAVALAGAEEIANEMNATILPSVLEKPAVRASLKADALPSRGHTLARVRLTQQGDKPLWKWWIYGTGRHFIGPRTENKSGLLVFYWERWGRVVAFESIPDHPGAKAHPSTRDELIAEFRALAHDTWTQRFAETLNS